MKRRCSGTLLALLFLGLVAVYPAWHRARCDAHLVPACTEQAGGSADQPDEQEPAGHDADCCPVCRLATAPLILLTLLAIRGPFLPARDRVVVREEVASSRLDPGLPFARGPPAHA